MTTKHVPSTLGEHYSSYYRKEKSADSPDVSRSRMVRAMTNFLLESGSERVRVVDIGSGRRELEGTLHRNAKGNVDPALATRLATTDLVSFDIADIPARRIIGQKGMHVRADSRAMPFQHDTFDLAVSNLSIDMLRREPGEFEAALREVRRVTKAGAKALFNFHSGHLFENLSRGYEGRDGILSSYFNGDPSQNPFYNDAATIHRDLELEGFTLEGVEPFSVMTPSGGEIEDTWWEVTATLY